MRQHGKGEAKYHCEADLERKGRSASWSVACSNRMLDAQTRQGVHPALSETVNQGLTALLQEVETISVDCGLDTAELRKMRDLLLKAARALAVESEKVAELRLLALTDDLTGFYNRRGFLFLASQQLKMSRRNQEPMVLFFIDVDNLKSTNDLNGHDEGDALLGRCAAALNNTFRDSDIIARLGGDEFSVLAWEGADRSSEAILQRLKSAVESVNAQAGITRLSLAVGVARFDPKDPCSLAELLSAADCDMYRQKRSRSAAVPESAGSG